MKIVYKLVTRGRPNLFKKNLSLFYERMSGHNEFEFLVPLDAGDLTMNNSSMKEFLSHFPHLSFDFFSPLGKIEATNLGLSDVEFDILVVLLDDMVPLVKDFDDIIVHHMNQYFPNLDGVLHFNDGYRRRQDLITIQIVGKQLFDYLGYLFHSDYLEYFCDREFTEVTYALNKVKYFPEVIIKHDHIPKKIDWKNHPDRAVFFRRQKLNFPKKSILEV